MMLMMFFYISLCSPVEDTVESLVNVTVTSKKSTEPSNKDFQDFVSDMQKTITSLRKQASLISERSDTVRAPCVQTGFTLTCQLIPQDGAQHSDFVFWSAAAFIM